MQNNYSEYLYFNGEIENPFTSDQDRELRKDVFWHYEKQHYNVKKSGEDVYTVRGYIKNILIHSLDENKPEMPHYQMYLNNSLK